MTVLEVLKKAKEEYERCGVNRAPVGTKECCALTAIHRYAPLGREWDVRVAFAEANGLDTIRTLDSIPRFTDTHTKEEVVEAFSKAIEYEVGRG